VTRRNRDRNSHEKNGRIIGTREVTEELQAAEKKAWLFVGRLTDTTTTEKIVRYLTRNGISGSIDCEEIPTRGTSKAFKVGIPYDQLKKIEATDFWPKDVLVKRYHFRFRRHPTEEESPFE